MDVVAGAQREKLVGRVLLCSDAEEVTKVTSLSVTGGVACALTRLLRPDEDPLLRVLDAWPLTVADLLGESGAAGDIRWSPGDGLASALVRLLRPDRQVMLLAIYALDVSEGDVPRVPRSAGPPPGKAEAA